MKDEIKEILEALKVDEEELELKSSVYPLELTLKEQKILLDYITNLQEENENRISESLSYDLAKAKIKELEYKIDKAIEYINRVINNKNWVNDNFQDIYGPQLLNLLQGKSDK